MAIRRVKFVWTGARENLPGPWRYGVWTVYDRDPGSRIKHLAISVRGLLSWLAGAAVAGYLLGGVALYWWFQRNPYNLVGLGDTLLMPVRWQHVRELRGRSQIAEGLADFKVQHWLEGSMKLRVGLYRAPHDWRARLALAQFDLAVNRRESSLKLLMDDLGWGYPGRAYLTTLFSIATEGEDYDVVIATCDRFLPTATADRVWLLTEKIKAQIASGRADEALALIDKEGESAGWQLREARVMALLALDRPDEAVSYLERWDREQPQAHVQVVRLKVRALREAKRLKEMDAALEEFRQLSPDDPRAYVYGIVQRYLAGQHEAAGKALDDYLLRFSGSADNMAVAASALVDARAPALVERCVKEAALHGFTAKPFLVWQLQVQISTGDWPGALRTVAALQPVMKAAPPNEQFAFEWMQCVVAAAAQPADGPTTALVEFLQKRPMPMRVYRLTIDALVLASRWSAAQSVIQLASRSYPSSRVLAGLQQKVDAALKAKAPPKVEFVSAPTSPSLSIEKQFFQQLEADEKAERWSDAARAIEQVRVEKPAWLGKRESDVLEAQMRVSIHTGDMLTMIGAAKVYLDGSSARAVHVVNVARELAKKSGARDDAEALVNEVLRKSPHFPPAERLLKEWHPPVPKKKK